MFKRILFALVFVATAWGKPDSALSSEPIGTKYEPTWESLDRRPNPAWFDDDKIGIFVSWGVYSVPAVAWVYPDKPYGFGGHSCWYGLYIDRLRPLSPLEQAKMEAFHRRTYGDVPFKALAALFKAEFFDPSQWADLFKRSGARYAFLTSNFHDGYCLWPSPFRPGWNSMDVGPKRDLLGDFTSAMRRNGLRAGFYYSLGEFDHPLYMKARKDGDLKPFAQKHMQPQLREAVKQYCPSFLYFDGEWEFPIDSFQMREFLAWLYNDSPCKDDVLVNDRFGSGSRGKHGGVYSSEAGVRESGTDHKWCEDRPISLGNWSYNRLERLEDYLSERDLIHLLIETVAQGGNLHLAISPCGDGTIPMLQQERLVQMGDWLKVNGEAIYGTRRWLVPHEGPIVESVNPRLDKDWKWTETKQRPMVHYTKKGDAVYAICLSWPGSVLKLDSPLTTPQTQVRMLDWTQPLTLEPSAKGIVIHIPETLIGERPCRNAWVFKMTRLAPPASCNRPISDSPAPSKPTTVRQSFLGVKAGDEREVGGVKLCWCPPGRFLMGSPLGESERRPDETQVEVRLTRGFWTGQCEVTQGQWKRVVGGFPGKQPTGEGDDFPVVEVSYAEAEGFCRTLTEQAHKVGDLPNDWVFRLPTEAQWEYACRAGTKTATAFGDKLSSTQANFQGRSYNGAEQGPSLKRAARVGSYPANAWGLHDMHGNVFEWCRDWYHRQLPGGDDPDLSSRTGTRNRDVTFSRVRRGGAWCDDGWPCRSACRVPFEPERRSNHIGFRVVAVQL